MNWDEAKQILLKDKEVQEELKNNEAEYKAIEAMIAERRAKNAPRKEPPVLAEVGVV